MPCYSSVQTKMTDPAMIAQALGQQGYSSINGDLTKVTAEKNGQKITFGKSGSVFLASGYVEELGAICRQYAEIGVRKFAKRTGFNIEKFDGRKMTLVRR